MAPLVVTFVAAGSPAPRHRGSSPAARLAHDLNPQHQGSFSWGLHIPYLAARASAPALPELGWVSRGWPAHSWTRPQRVIGAFQLVRTRHGISLTTVHVSCTSVNKLAPRVLGDPLSLNT